MKHLISIFLVSIFICTSCTKEENTISISGQILNYDKAQDEVILYVPDIYNSNQEVAAKIKHNGKFKLHYKSTYTHSVYLSYKNMFPIIAHPNEEIILTIDDEKLAEQPYKAIGFHDNSAQVNNNLFSYLDMESEFAENCSLDSLVKIKIPTEIKPYKDSLYNEQMSRLENFMNTNKPSDELKDWIEANIIYSYAADLLFAPSYYTHNNRGITIEMPADYYSFLETIPTVNRQSLINNVAKSYLYGYRREVIMKAIDKNNKLSSTQFYQATLDSILAMPDEEKEFKQLLASSFLFERIAVYNLAIYEKKRAEINKLFGDDPFFDGVKEKYVEVKEFLSEPLKTKEVTYIHDVKLSGEDIHNQILKDGKGKVIYIDMWSTSCSGCIQDFPSANKLKIKYKKDDVLFVYICSHSKEKKWKEIIRKKRLKGLHYLMTDVQGYYINKQYSYKRINPHYIIIDKQGEIKHTGSEYRASHVKTSNIIDDLLQQ